MNSDVLEKELAEVERRSGEFSAAFYVRLFERVPGLRSLFEHVDMESQGQMLIQALGLVVKNLDRLDQLDSVLHELGYRHVEYGVEAEHYPVAVELLVATLKDFVEPAGEGYSEAVWTEALGYVADTMVAGIDLIGEGRKREREKRGGGSFAIPQANHDRYLARFVQDDVLDEVTPDAVISSDLPKHFEVEFEGDKTVDATPLQTLYQTAIQNGIPHMAECGGKAKCTTCRVLISDGLENCLPRNIPERKMAQMKGFAPEVRLGCQTRVSGPVTCRRLVIDEEDVSEAVEGGISSAGRELPLAVMFADIRGFTSISGKNLPYDVIHALNRYFRLVCEEIDKRHGYVDKYIGDGLMVLFGLSRDRETHPCVDAVDAAIAMQHCLPKLNDYLKDHLGMDFQIGVGVHYGPVVVGELGFPLKKQFTAIGDVVNVSARIEGQCKHVGAGILVSGPVVEHVPKGKYQISEGVSVELAGKELPEMVYSVDY